MCLRQPPNLPKACEIDEDRLPIIYCHHNQTLIMRDYNRFVDLSCQRVTFIPTNPVQDFLLKSHHGSNLLAQHVDIHAQSVVSILSRSWRSPRALLHTMSRNYNTKRNEHGHLCSDQWRTILLNFEIIQDGGGIDGCFPTCLKGKVTILSMFGVF